MTTLEIRLQAMTQELAKAEPSAIHQGASLTDGDILSDDNLPGLWKILNGIC